MREESVRWLLLEGVGGVVGGFWRGVCFKAFEVGFVVRDLTLGRFERGAIRVGREIVLR